MTSPDEIVTPLNGWRAPRERGMVRLRLALIRFEAAVEAREAGAAAWEELQKKTPGREARG